jgi:hypothetical protein
MATDHAIACLAGFLGEGGGGRGAEESELGLEGGSSWRECLRERIREDPGLQEYIRQRVKAQLHEMGYSGRDKEATDPAAAAAAAGTDRPQQPRATLLQGVLKSARNDLCLAANSLKDIDVTARPRKTTRTGNADSRAPAASMSIWEQLGEMSWRNDGEDLMVDGQRIGPASQLIKAVNEGGVDILEDRDTLVPLLDRLCELDGAEEQHQMNWSALMNTLRRVMRSLDDDIASKGLDAIWKLFKTASARDAGHGVSDLFLAVLEHVRWRFQAFSLVVTAGEDAPLEQLTLLGDSTLISTLREVSLLRPEYVWGILTDQCLALTSSQMAAFSFMLSVVPDCFPAMHESRVEDLVSSVASFLGPSFLVPVGGPETSATSREPAITFGLHPLHFVGLMDPDAKWLKRWLKRWHAGRLYRFFQAKGVFEICLLALRTEGSLRCGSRSMYSDRDGKHVQPTEVPSRAVRTSIRVILSSKASAFSRGEYLPLPLVQLGLLGHAAYFVGYFVAGCRGVTGPMSYASNVTGALLDLLQKHSNKKGGQHKTKFLSALSAALLMLARGSAGNAAIVSELFPPNILLQLVSVLEALCHGELNLDRAEAADTTAECLAELCRAGLEIHVHPEIRAKYRPLGEC